MAMFKLYSYIGVALLAIAAVSWIYYSGRRDMRDAIDSQNVEAAGVANEASMSLTNCNNLGGMYIFESGKCKWTETKHRK